MPKVDLCGASVKYSILVCILLILVVACGVPPAAPVVTEIIDPTQTEIPTGTLPPHSPGPESTATLETTTTIAVTCPPLSAHQQKGSIVEFIDAANSRVLIDGLTYRVKYLGIIVPLPGSKHSEISKQKNIELVQNTGVMRLFISKGLESIRSISEALEAPNLKQSEGKITVDTHVCKRGELWSE